MLCTEKYKCECGLSFPRSQDKASHCKHCKVHILRKAEQRRLQEGTEGAIPMIFMSDPTTAATLVARAAAIAPFVPARTGYAPQSRPRPGLTSVDPGLASPTSSASLTACFDLVSLATVASAASVPTPVPSPANLFDPVLRTKRAKHERLDADALFSRLALGTFQRIVVLLGPEASVPAHEPGCSPLSPPTLVPLFPPLSPPFSSSPGLSHVLSHVPLELQGGARLRADGAAFSGVGFVKDPAPLYRYCRDLFLGNSHPTTAHFFVKLLAEKGLLRRVYTQNFDDLERTVGVPEKLLVQCRGNLRTARCARPQCGTTCPIDVYAKTVCMKEVPLCPRCTCPVRPDILFAEEESGLALHDMLLDDLRQCDLVLTIGSPGRIPRPFTPMQAAPVVSIQAQQPPQQQQQLHGGLSPAPPTSWIGPDIDLLLAGNCLEEIAKLVFRVGWLPEFGDAWQAYRLSCVRQSLPVPPVIQPAFAEGMLVSVAMPGSGGGAVATTGSIVTVIETPHYPLYRVALAPDICMRQSDIIVPGERLASLEGAASTTNTPAPAGRMSIGFLTD